MTEAKYKELLSGLEVQFESNKKALARKYAFENQMFQKGDTIQKDDTIIVIDTIKWGFGYSCLPSVSYEGNKLTKKLETPKRGDKRANIWQRDGSGITKINNTAPTGDKTDGE